TRDTVPAAHRAAAVSAGLPRHAATASGHAVGGRHLPAASRPLRGSLAAVGRRVDAAASKIAPPNQALQPTRASGLMVTARPSRAPFPGRAVRWYANAGPRR